MPVDLHTALDPDVVTVVVPCRNEEGSIGACLASILSEKALNLQVLVADGDSEDATREVVAEVMGKDPRVELLRNPARTVPHALNIALDAAKGAWFVRVDAHSTIPPGYLCAVVEHLRSGRWGGVGGRKDGVGSTAQGRAIAAAMSSRFGVGGSRYHYATEPQVVEHIPFGAYPTALARRIGGWDVALAVNQDFEFDRRIGLTGHELLLDPSLVISWECPQRVTGLFQQYRRYGSGKVDVLRKHPTSASPRHLAPPALVALLVGAAGAGTRRPLRGTAAALPYLAFLVAGTRDVRSRLPGDPVAKAFAGPALAAMHVGWGVGFWQGVWRHLRGAWLRRDPSLGAERERARQMETSTAW